MGLDLKNIKKAIDKVENKIPDDVKAKAKELTAKENLEKVKGKANDLFEKGKDKLGNVFDKDDKKDDKDKT